MRRMEKLNNKRLPGIENAGIKEPIVNLAMFSTDNSLDVADKIPFVELVFILNRSIQQFSLINGFANWVPNSAGNFRHVDSSH